MSVGIVLHGSVKGTDSVPFNNFARLLNLMPHKPWNHIPKGKPFTSFEKFALAPLWHGLEIKSMSRLVEYVKEDAEAVKLVQAEMGELKKQGAPEGHDS